MGGTPESGGVANVKPSGELHNWRYAKRNARLTPTSERRAVLRVSRPRHQHVLIVGCLGSPRSSQRLKYVSIGGRTIDHIMLSCTYVSHGLKK